MIEIKESVNGYVITKYHNSTGNGLMSLFGAPQGQKTQFIAKSEEDVMAIVKTLLIEIEVSKKTTTENLKSYEEYT